MIPIENILTYSQEQVLQIFEMQSLQIIFEIVQENILKFSKQIKFKPEC